MALMAAILEWLRENSDVFGFAVAALIFLITVVLVSRKMIGFWISLLFLLFALISGLLIGNQHFIKEWMTKKSTVEASSTSELPSQ
jgi:hypothetical protein